MKLTKSFMKRLLIIILSVFVILPMILIVFGVPKTLEGFYTVPSGSQQILTGFDISGVTLYDGDVSYTGAVGEALYCAYGDISCTNSDYTLTNTRDVSGVSLYQCVNSSDSTDICANVTICNSSIALKGTSINSSSLYTFSDASRCGLDVSSTPYTYSQLTINDGNLSESSNLIGFSSPFTTPPMEISGSYVYIYDTDTSYSSCFLFESNGYDCLANCEGGGENNASDDNSKQQEDCPPAPATTEKCVADFGTQIGEKLCCGQTGVLQKGGEVCPKSKPICKGYECGSSWGKCYEE
jgi:hypothetical protein